MSQLTNEQQNQQMIPGGWTPFRALTPEDEKVFKEVTNKLMGVDYTPQSVSTQVVDGINYKFLCSGKVVAPGTESHEYMIQVYQAPGGSPEIVSISHLYSSSPASNAMLGGWSAWAPLDAASKNVFEQAINGMVGVSYTPEEVSKQIVAGTNYMFRCIAKPATLNPIEYKALVEIFQPLGEGAKPIITSIVQTNW